MRMPGRFEWKILGVVLLVAALSAGTAGYAARYVLRGVASFAQHERQTADSGSVAAEVFRSYFADRKEEFRRRTERIAATAPTRMSDLAGEQELLRARLYEGTRCSTSGRRRSWRGSGRGRLHPAPRPLRRGRLARSARFCPRGFSSSPSAFRCRCTIASSS